MQGTRTEGTLRQQEHPAPTGKHIALSSYTLHILEKPGKYWNFIIRIPGLEYAGISTKVLEHSVYHCALFMTEQPGDPGSTRTQAPTMAAILMGCNVYLGWNVQAPTRGGILMGRYIAVKECRH